MISPGRALVALISLALLLTLAPAALAAPGKLSIRHWPRGYFGFVKTAQNGCMEGREVVLYKRTGKRPDPSADRRLARGRSALLGAGKTGQWSVRAASGKPVYAVAPKRGRCGRIFTRVLAPLAPRGDVQPCDPNRGPVEYCRFDRLHLDLYGMSFTLVPCPSISATFGRCSGYPRVGLYPWGGPGVRAAELEWQALGGPKDHSRWMKATMFKNNTEEPTFSLVEGVIEAPESARFGAKEVWGPKTAQASGSGRYFTPDLPGVGPGEIGGPLYMNFENGRWGADVHIWGYLFER